ncbi:exodeoxyribonuclease VII small subunit [Candidatus Sumerlaeota bacterium]|nr:exodeoxyribonuclease VII small subunit [Candidatus Sumerlaeota bacterium]
MEKKIPEKNGEKFDFEKAMKRLEKIVEELENGQPPLHKALDLFQEGKNLSRVCHNELTRFEQKIQKIIEDEKGEISFEDFTDDAPENKEEE